MSHQQTKLDLSTWLKAVVARAGGEQTDGELLNRFLAEHDEGSFAALVKRHGAMVLGVCRRVLGNAADADDAFQATFLVLVRKARRLRRRAVIGDWLHGVARRTALKARSAAVRRRTVEKHAAKSDNSVNETRNDWLPRLDYEVSRLPEKYRLPIVLCDLEGRTRRDAVRQLGWPEGTVAGRLAWGRELLAKKLLREAQIGVGVAIGSAAGGVAHAALPTRLVYSTIQAASALMAGHGAAQAVVSAGALTLTKGVVQAMFWSKVKTAGVVLVATAALAGAGGKTYQMVAEGGGHWSHPQGIATQKSPQEGDNIQANKETLEAQLAADRNQYEARWKEWEAGLITVDFIVEAIRQLHAVETELARTNSGKVNAAKAALERMSDLYLSAKVKYDEQDISLGQLELARAAQAEFRGKLLAAQVRMNDREGALKKAAEETWESRFKEFGAGKIIVDNVLDASHLLLKADLRLAPGKAETVAAQLAHLERTIALERIAKQMYDRGQIPIGQYSLCTYHRIEAEIMLDEARRGK